MLGKWTVIALSLTAIAAVACRKTPTALQENPMSTPIVLASQPEKPGGIKLLSRAIAAYERQPTGERAVEVWMAFADIDAELSKLKREVARRVGGARAEAEISRIELQRTRDQQMERFAKTQARMENARAAFNNLAASINQKEGVRAAASVIARGLSSEAGDWRHGVRGAHGRLPTQ